MHDRSNSPVDFDQAVGDLYGRLPSNAYTEVAWMEVLILKYLLPGCKMAEMKQRALSLAESMSETGKNYIVCFLLNGFAWRFFFYFFLTALHFKFGR